VSTLVTDPEHPCALPALEAFAARAAAVCIAPGVEQITITGVGITGPGDGISMAGAAAVLIRGVEIHDTGYYGLRIFEAKLQNSPIVIVPSAVTLEQVAVNRAREAGVMLVGSKLDVKESSIQHTLNLNGLGDVRPVDATPEELEQLAVEIEQVPEDLRVGWARGISIHPGWWSADASAEPASFARSEVTIAETVITGNVRVNAPAGDLA
jgi:hypothetical protein